MHASPLLDVAHCLESAEACVSDRLSSTARSAVPSGAQAPLTPGSASSGDDSGGSPLARNPLRSMAITPQSSAGGGLHDAAAVAAAIVPHSGGSGSAIAHAAASPNAAGGMHTFPAGVPEDAAVIGGASLPASPPRPKTLKTSSGSCEAAPWPPSPVHVARHAAAQDGATSSPGASSSPSSMHLRDARRSEGEGLFTKPRPAGALSPRSFYRPTALTSLPVGPAVAELRREVAGPDEPHTPDTKPPLAAARKGAMPLHSGSVLSPPSAL